MGLDEELGTGFGHEVSTTVGMGSGAVSSVRLLRSSGPDSSRSTSL
jgi:hypothetical protein